MLDDRCEEWSGFTDSEVRKLLDDNGLNEHYNTGKSWYDGYRIGQNNIYCPWDVVNYCDQLLNDLNKEAQNYWANVSENGIIRTFAEKADSITHDEIGSLMEGKTVNERLTQRLSKCLLKKLAVKQNRKWLKTGRASLQSLACCKIV